VVALPYLYYFLPYIFEAHSRGTHRLWTSAPSPTSRGGACNQVSCLDLWVPRFPTNFKLEGQHLADPLAIACGSTSLSHVLSPLAHRTLYMRFFESSLSPSTSSHVQQRNAHQHMIISTVAGSQNKPWDPGVSVTRRRQVPPHAPAAPAPPPSAPVDGRHYTLTRHKDRGDLMHRVSKGKRSGAVDRGVVSNDHVRSNEAESDRPFVPHHTSPDLPVHHPSDPPTTRLAHPSGAHAASRATHIPPHPVRRCPLLFYCKIPVRCFSYPAAVVNLALTYCLSCAIIRVTVSPLTATVVWA
jgi:hypothetical protein